MTLLETYAKRISVAEKIHQEKFHESMSDVKKLTLAVTLNNTTKYINEKFENSVGTQRAALGDYKKFCINLTNVAVPNLIGTDIVNTYPMSSITGYITYIKYTAGSNKGQTKQGDVFNDPFRLGKVDVNYTGAPVVETVAADQTVIRPAWTPVIGDKIIAIAADGTETELALTDGAVTVEAGAYIKAKYVYDNIVIPQNDLPILNAELAEITLKATARRIAIYYSSIAAFQAKTDYGFDMGKQLAEKAKGQLAYEVDTEITNLLIDNAAESAELKFNKRVPFGISMSQHYEAFNAKIEAAKKIIYKKTKRFMPNFMLVSPELIEILSFIKGYSAVSLSKVNGPYYAGTLNGLKVYVTPNIEDGKYILGVNSDGLEASAAVFAPYMMIVPTQLLEFADGANSQGFSSMYDLKLLNADLLIKGTVVDEDYVVATEQVQG